MTSTTVFDRAHNGVVSNDHDARDPPTKATRRRFSVEFKNWSVDGWDDADRQERGALLRRVARALEGHEDARPLLARTSIGPDVDSVASRMEVFWGEGPPSLIDSRRTSVSSSPYRRTSPRARPASSRRMRSRTGRTTTTSSSSCAPRTSATTRTTPRSSTWPTLEAARSYLILPPDAWPE